MNTLRIQPWVRATCLLLGIGLVLIGGRFLVAPEAGETGFGLHYAQPNYAFHSIKGIRDVFSGVIIFLFAWHQYRKPLLFTLLAGSLIPLTDLLIVWQTPDSIPSAMPVHGGTALLLWVLCYFLTRSQAPATRHPEKRVKVLESAAEGARSVLELTLLPGERTPWHYHRQFSESFEVIQGALTVGKGLRTTTLHQGQHLTIERGEKHFFNNTSGKICQLKVTIAPANQEFETALLISQGLSRDGMATTNGTPATLSDLALFIHLNDSHLVGWQKLAQPLFAWLAARAIRQGRLGWLMERYVHVSALSQD